MTLTLNLPEALERRLESEARRRGLTATELALQLIHNALPLDTEEQKRANEATLELFRRWEAEDATLDPEEIAKRERDWEELRDHLDADHGSFRKPIR